MANHYVRFAGPVLSEDATGFTFTVHRNYLQDNWQILGDAGWRDLSVDDKSISFHNDEIFRMRKEDFELVQHWVEKMKGLDENG